jgi:hypothetical protein
MITWAERKTAARVFRVFRARPHAYSGKHHFYTEGHSGDYPLGSKRAFDQAHDSEASEIGLDRMGADPTSAPSLHVGATALVSHPNHSFFQEVIKTLALGIVQCMPSHPKHGEYVARTQQLCERVTGAQKVELSPRPVVGGKSREPRPYPPTLRVGQHDWIDPPAVEAPIDKIAPALAEPRERKARRSVAQPSLIRLQHPYTREESVGLYPHIWGLDVTPPAQALQHRVAPRLSNRKVRTSRPSVCATWVVYSRDDFAVGALFKGGLGLMPHQPLTCGRITAKVRVGTVWEYRVSGCRCALA